MIGVKFQSEEKFWRTVSMTGVPREDELVLIDEIEYRVTSVMWDPFGGDSHDVIVVLA